MTGRPIIFDAESVRGCTGAVYCAQARVAFDPVPCPVCWHRETMTARFNDRESCRDDVVDDHAVMRWSPGPRRGGACGNPGMPSRWDRGVWECGACGFRCTPEEAGILIDGVLHASDPDCDSITTDASGYRMSDDARRAMRGGRDA